MSYSPTSQQRSTKGASKQRRDLINMEIDGLKDLLPLPDSVRQRLFQLQVMSLVCIFIRKDRYLPHILGENCVSMGGGRGSGFTPFPPPPPPQPRLLRMLDVCKALRGFLLMVTRQGKLLYISENVTDYLGHSVEEIMSQGDSLYDLVDIRDHGTVQTELLSGPPSLAMHMRFPDERVFICRMNLSRTAKRQLQYQKFILIHGRYLHPAEYYQALLSLTAPGLFVHPCFAAFCQPLITPENADALAAGNTTIFSSLHHMNMTFLHLDDIGIAHLGYKKKEMIGKSWYRFIHPHDLPDVSFKHKLLCEDKETSCILLVRLQSWSGEWLWLHTVLAVREGLTQRDNNMDQIILATYQLLSEIEAATLQANNWIYSIPHRYSENTVYFSSVPTTTSLLEPTHISLQNPAFLRHQHQILVSPDNPGSKCKRKYVRSASAGRQNSESDGSISAGSLQGDCKARRHFRHSSCTDEFNPFLPASNTHSNTFPGGLHADFNNGSLGTGLEFLGDQEGNGALIDQIRVEIPFHSSPYLNGSAGTNFSHQPNPSSQNTIPPELKGKNGQLCVPTLLTPESSPANSSSSSNGHPSHHNNGRLPLCVGQRVEARGPPALQGPHPINPVPSTTPNTLPVGEGGGSGGMGGLPVIEAQSLAAYLHHVETEPILLSDPLLSDAAPHPPSAATTSQADVKEPIMGDVLSLSPEGGTPSLHQAHVRNQLLSTAFRSNPPILNSDSVEEKDRNWNNNEEKTVAPTSTNGGPVLARRPIGCLHPGPSDRSRRLHSWAGHEGTLQ